MIRRRKEAPPVSLAFWRTSTDPALSYPLPQRKLAARAWLLDPAGHPSDIYYSDAAATEVSKLVDSFKPHLIVLEGLWLHRYIPLLKRHGCRLVLDLHAVEAAMFGEIADSTHGDDLKSKLLRKVLPERVKLIERQAVNAVDQIWVCSQQDARLMEQVHRPFAPIHVVPNTLEVDSYEPARAGRCPARIGRSNQKRRLFFRPSFNGSPNAAAGNFLIEEVFPGLARAFPDCQLLLVGTNRRLP